MHNDLFQWFLSDLSRVSFLWLNLNENPCHYIGEAMSKTIKGSHATKWSNELEADGQCTKTSTISKRYQWSVWNKDFQLIKPQKKIKQSHKLYQQFLTLYNSLQPLLEIQRWKSEQFAKHEAISKKLLLLITVIWIKI